VGCAVDYDIQQVYTSVRHQYHIANYTPHFSDVRVLAGYEFPTERLPRGLLVSDNDLIILKSRIKIAFLMPIKDMNKKYSFTSYSQLESKYPSRKPPQ
jgi:hypothetical protein